MDRGSAPPLLEVRDLSVVARQRKGDVLSIVEGVSFDVRPGEVIALIGESGSGKTTISLACMGYARPGCEIAGGSVRLGDRRMLDLSLRERRGVRGRDVAYVAQSAAAAFNGALTLGMQVTEAPVMKGLLSGDEARAKATALYRELDLPEPETIGRRYPHQVSGGQLQRMMAAMAMICDPRLLILDEPTTALDVTTQVEVLRAFKKLIRGRNTSAIYVSHDLAVVAQIADHVLVLRDGAMVELGTAEDIIARPAAPYTRELIGAAHVMPATVSPGRPPPDPERTGVSAPLLRVSRVTAGYGRKGEHIALRDVSLEAFASRTLGIIGESGSGKTTLGRVIAGLTPALSGEVAFIGHTLGARVGERDREQLRAIQFAFQMADVALNPRHRVDKILGRPLSFYFDLDEARVAAAGTGAAGAGRAARELRVAIPETALRRRAAAGQSRPGAGRGAEADRLRRDHLGAGHGGGPGDSRPAARPAGTAARGLPVHLARHLHGRAGRRYHCRDAKWRDRGTRTDGNRAAAAPSSVHRASAEVGPRHEDGLAGHAGAVGARRCVSVIEGFVKWSRDAGWGWPAGPAVPTPAAGARRRTQGEERHGSNRTRIAR